MAAVLAHAITDGWTTTGGNWPISKGVVRGVDWATFTASETDRTSLGGASRTARYIRIAVGTSTANATSNAGADATSAQVGNMDFTITSWHIFSNPALCDYIHVVCNFSNGTNSDCYTQFGFGCLDKHGMTYTGLVYATGNPRRAYSSLFTSAFYTAIDYNCGPAGGALTPWTGRAGFSYTTNYNSKHALQWIIDPTLSPLPGSGWLSTDTVQNAAQVLNPIQPHGYATSYQFTTGWRTGPTSADIQYSAWPQFTLPQPYSGAVSMSPLPFMLLQNTANTSLLMFLGSFPDVRSCSMEGYAPQSIVTYGSEEWMLFPLMRSTAWDQCQQPDVVSSGRSGFAFKKVP
jgi:hypothetical protein